MVIEGENIMYRNVVCHSYEIHYTDFEKALDDFNEKLVQAGLTINGPLFYALHNAPLEEIMDIDIYIPVEQQYVDPATNLLFQSYFYIENMLMTRVKEDFNVNTEKAYEEIFRYAIDVNLQIASPMYHIIRGDEELQWVDLKIKVFSEDDEDDSLSEREEGFLEKYTRRLGE